MEENTVLQEMKPKRSNKAGIIVLICVLGTLLLAGAVWGAFTVIDALYKALNAQPKKFTEKELTITVTDEFEKTEQEGFDFCLESKYVGILGLKQRSDAKSVEDYAENVISYNDKNSKVMTKDGLTYFYYKYKVDGTNYRYVVFAYKSTGGNYWLVQFVLDDKAYEEYEEKIFEWAKSVEMADYKK